jgi:hypothetical protein
MPVEWGANSKTCAQSAKLAPNDPPLIGANLGVVRALRSAVLALDVRELDGFKRFGPCTYPHVEISSKFEALGPRNGRGRTSSNPLKVKLFRLRRGLQHLRPSKFHGFFAVPFSLCTNSPVSAK